MTGQSTGSERGLRSTILHVLEKEHDGPAPVIVVIVVAALRSFGEILVGRPLGAQTYDLLPTSLLMNFAQVLAFYALAYHLFSTLLALTLSRKVTQVVVPVGLGLFLGVFPPLIDGLANPGSPIRYFYATEPSWLFLGETMPAGETAILWTTIGFTGLFTLYITRSVPRFLAATAGAWVVLQILGVWLNLLLVAALGDISFAIYRLCFLGIVFSVWVATRWRHLLYSLVRINHALPLAMLTLAGGLWVHNGRLEVAVVTVIVLLVTFVLIVHNDWHDRDADRIEGRETRIGRADYHWTWFFLGVGLLTTLIWSQMIALILVVYVAVSVLYHSPAIRLKRVFCVSYKIEGIWGASAFLAGALVDPTAIREAGTAVVLVPALLVFLGQALVSGLKDWKDIDSDRHARAHTYYTLAEREGRDPSRTHLVLANASGIALLSAPVALWCWAGWHVSIAVVGLLAIAPPLWVLVVRDRNRAVEGMFWLLSVYLAVLAWTMNAVSPVVR